MTYKKLIVILFSLYSTFCFAQQNLIQNGSFEDSLGNPSLTGWDLGWDTSRINLSIDVPPNGGSWSVNLECSYFASSYIISHLTGMQGTYIYNLIFWTKYTANYFSYYPPYIGIGIKTNSLVIWRPDSILQQSTVYVYDSIINNWQQITLLDTITSSAQDTIAIILFGGAFTTGGEYSFAFFDLIDLTVTDTLTSIQNTIHLQDSEIEIFPNPFNDYTTIEFKNKKHEHIQLTLFTITGQVIRKIETSQDHISIKRGELSDGMYFYKLINQNNGTLLGRGKLVLQ